MVYTFKINDVSEKSSNLIKMLFALAKDNDFVEAVNDSESLTSEQKQELENRYQKFIKNPTEGKTWELLKSELIEY